VECKVQVTTYAPAKTSVKTAKTTTTIAAPAQTYTVTETTTLEATSTYLPTPASSTVSTLTIVVVEETTTPSATVTTTETVTNTINAPTVTEYPQCNPENYVSILLQSATRCCCAMTNHTLPSRSAPTEFTEHPLSRSPSMA